MKLTSSAFSDNEVVPVQFTCLGSNTNPPLEIADIPDNTRSLVLTIADIDAFPQPWIHWFVYNIPTSTRRIEQGVLPPGASEGHANRGSFGYEGPCPLNVEGTHHYIFLLHALDTVLEINATSTYWDVQEMIERHTIAKAELMGLLTGTGEAMQSIT